MADALVPLYSTTLASAASSVTISGIPSTYRDLRLVINATTNAPGPDDVAIRFNSDSGSNYSTVRMAGTGSAATSSNSSGTTGYIGVAVNSSSSVLITTDVMDYSATDKQHTFLSRGNQGDGWVTGHAGRWANTAAITSITVTIPSGSTWNYQAGSTFSIFGIVG